MKRRNVILIIFAAVPLLVLAGFILSFFGSFYHADSTALDALHSGEAVTVREIPGGWLFNGPSEEAALIFYPGGKVEETAYAPLLNRIAEGGIDVFLRNFHLERFLKKKLP